MIDFSTFNARVKFTSLSLEEGALTIQIGFDYENGQASTIKKEATPKLISDIIGVLDLHAWEELPRKFARVRIGQNGKVTSIGNVIENRWADMQ